MNYIIKDISSQKPGIFKFDNLQFEYIRKNHTRNVFYEKELHICNHWTGGHRHQLYDFYGVNLTEINNKIYLFRTLKRKEKSEGVWQRNTNLINNTMCLLANKDINFPSQNLLIALALLNAEQCAWYDLKPDSNIQLPKKKLLNPTTLITVPGTIVAPIIADHQFFANHDYPGERVDIGKERIDFVRRKAFEFYGQLKSGKRQFQLLELIK